MPGGVTLQAYLDKITTLKDGSVRVTFTSQELSAESCTALMQYRQQFGWLLFSGQTLSDLDIPKDQAKDFRDDKTPSQRMRGVLYVLWKHLGSPDTFVAFYSSEMERQIERVKERLEPQL